MAKPRVDLYTLCWDEADMLGFFFRHYDSWVDRYVVYDDGSTDGSQELLAAHPKVELRRFERSDATSFCLSQQQLQNEIWKESRGRADWVVVTALDEHLHVPGRDMSQYLAEQTARGVTLLPALGFDMNARTMPPDEGRLVDVVTRGQPQTLFNKLSVFDPHAMRDTGFHTGRHTAQPHGDLWLPARDELVLWHYKRLGFDRCAKREGIQAMRLGPTDLEEGYGEHYRRTQEQFRATWAQMEAESIELRDVAAERVCAPPLWWTARQDIRRDHQRTFWERARRRLGMR